MEDIKYETAENINWDDDDDDIPSKRDVKTTTDIYNYYNNYENGNYSEMREKAREDFLKADSIPTENNVAIVFDMDETLISRGYVFDKEKAANSGDSDIEIELNYFLARPGLFELLDGLKKQKAVYQEQHPGKEFNIYIYTSSTSKAIQDLKDFLGEDYASLFKEFFSRDSDITTQEGAFRKALELFEEDTVLYFADGNDAPSAVENASMFSQQGKKIVGFSIPGFVPDGFYQASLYMEFNRHLHEKIQNMIGENNPKATQCKEELDKISRDLLKFLGEINNCDRIDGLLNSISSQLQGTNEDELDPLDSYTCACVAKKIEIPSVLELISNRNFIEKYSLLFEQTYGSDATLKMNEIKSKYEFDRRTDQLLPQAYHPAEIYPHSKGRNKRDLDEI